MAVQGGAALSSVEASLEHSQQNFVRSQRRQGNRQLLAGFAAPRSRNEQK